jgi:hypothetical protein
MALVHDASGGVPGSIRRGEDAPQEQLVVADSMAASASPGRLPGRRMEDGRRRCFSAPANCVARRRRRAWRARARRSFGRRSYIGHKREVGQACTARTPRERRWPAQAVSAMDTGEVGDLGPDGLSWAGLWPGRRVGVLGWSGPGCGLLKLN